MTIRLSGLLSSSGDSFAIVPSGQYAYQNAYWIEPDALQAQAVAPNHIADAHAQQHNQWVIA